MTISVRGWITFQKMPIREPAYRLLKSLTTKFQSRSRCEEKSLRAEPRYEGDRRPRSDGKPMAEGAVLMSVPCPRSSCEIVAGGPVGQASWGETLADF